jgi:putative tryptophan/tyrosine transport system permease protein
MLLLSGLNTGIVLAVMALGIMLTYRMMAILDLTPVISCTLAGAVTMWLQTAGWSPLFAIAIGCSSGAFAGLMTALIHTRSRMPSLLAGLMVVMLLDSLQWRLAVVSIRRTEAMTWLDLEITLIVGLAALALLLVLLYSFLRTQRGTILRAVGDSPQMLRPMGINLEHQIITGLVLSNALVALAASTQIVHGSPKDLLPSSGMPLWALASVMISSLYLTKIHLGRNLLVTSSTAVLVGLAISAAQSFGFPHDLLNPLAVVALIACWRAQA